MRCNREFYEDLVKGYLAAVDARELEAVLAHFNENAVVRAEPRGTEATGLTDLRVLYQSLMSTYPRMEHETRMVIVDVDRRAAAVDLTFHHERADGLAASLHDATHLLFDTHGLISELTFWLGHDLA